MFWTQNLFGSQNFFAPKSYSTSNFSLARNLFWTQFFAGLIFSLSTFCYNKILLDPNFFGPKHLLFWSKNVFMGPTFLINPKYFWTYFTLGAKVF